MTEELERLIELARHHKITPEERREQRIRYVWSCMVEDHPELTVEDVRGMLRAGGLIA